MPGAFIQAEKLIADIYNELKKNHLLFEKTLFLVTYDEHGGFCDHVSPPSDFMPPYAGQTDQKSKFDFKQLGPRVPALLINPRIAEASLDRTIYDHTAILKMVAGRFLGGTDKFKSGRKKYSANPIENLTESGNTNNMPTVECLEADDRPPGWKLALADRLDDLQIELMKALLALRGGAHAVANISLISSGKAMQTDSLKSL